MGFRPDEASSALKASNGDVQQAIESLLSRRGGPSGRGGTSRQSSYESRDGDRGVGRGRRDRKEDDEGRLWDLYFTCDSRRKTQILLLQHHYWHGLCWSKLMTSLVKETINFQAYRLQKL